MEGTAINTDSSTKTDFDAEYLKAWEEYEKVLVPFQKCLRHIEGKLGPGAEWRQVGEILISIWSEVTNKEWYKVNETWMRLKQ